VSARRSPSGFRAFARVTVLLAAGACSQPPADGRFTQTSLPDSGSFWPVAELLDVRCGSLDCHGTAFRNLRLYGSAGLRLSPGDAPLLPLCDTAGEVTQDYVSVVGLEPEIMPQVASGGDVGLLTMVRKARGTEAHKGGQIWTTGDDSDRCLSSWLGGTPNPGDCASALGAVLPTGKSNPLMQCLDAAPMP
jgi:hypothetical protein